jgi:hypothetical protein
MAAVPQTDVIIAERAPQDHQGQEKRLSNM